MCNLAQDSLVPCSLLHNICVCLWLWRSCQLVFITAAMAAAFSIKLHHIFSTSRCVDDYRSDQTRWSLLFSIHFCKKTQYMQSRNRYELSFTCCAFFFQVILFSAVVVLTNALSAIISLMIEMPIAALEQKLSSGKTEKPKYVVHD